MHRKLNAISHGEQQQLYVSFDDQPEEPFTTSSFVVANAAPSTTILAQGGGAPSYQDALLDVTWLETTGENRSMVYLTELARRAMDTHDISDEADVHHKQAKSVSIRSEQPIKYVVDGENYTAKTIDVSVMPASLRVFTSSY